MIKRIVASGGVLVLALALAAGPALAKNPCSPKKKGPAGCKNEITACITSDCGGLKGKPKRQCKSGCKRSTVSACQTSTSVCSGSPSGAFLVPQS